MAARIFGWRRLRKAAFWHFGVQRLVVAVLERGTAEPLLLACARAVGEGPGRFAPGVLECCLAVGAVDLPHIAYLGIEASRLTEAGAGGDSTVSGRRGAGPRLAPGDGTDEPEIGDAGGVRDRVMYSPTGVEICVPVEGNDRLAVECDSAAALEIIEMFEEAGLGLAAIDCADCAMLSLAEYLAPTGEIQVVDPLAAVSVAPACESAAVTLGEALAVPIGGALVRLGALGDGQG